MEKFNISGIEITVLKKKMKNMYLRVVPTTGAVQIRAPMDMAEEKIRDFVQSHLDWIEKQRQRFRELPKQVAHRYQSGETFYLWGSAYTLEVMQNTLGNRVWILGQTIYLQVREKSTLKQRAETLQDWYREQLKEAIPAVLARGERVVGVKAAEGHIKNMRTRWGTCNIQAKRIWLNLQLAQKSSACLEYVMTHELVHLLERNHNAVFKAYMEQFYPQWRQRKKELDAPLPPI